MWELFVEKMHTLGTKQLNLTHIVLTQFVFDAAKPTAKDEFCGGNSCLQFARESFQQTVEELANNFGIDKFRWGIDVHNARFEHPVYRSSNLFNCMAGRQVGTPGGTETINVGSPTLLKYKFDQYFGVTYRQVVDLANMEQSVFIMPMGSSGDFFTNNYDAFLSTWSQGEYIPMKTRDYAVKHTLTLKNRPE